MSKYVNVKFKKSHPGFGYFSGDFGIVNIKYAFGLAIEGYVSFLLLASLKSGLLSMRNRIRKVLSITFK